jgi:DNA-binding transcriptional LysR family regulator
MDDVERIERRLKLQDLRALVTVAAAGSMHKAAERLGLSQPAISRAIADLEHAVGARLLDRSPHGIELTPFGEALVKRSLTVFDELRLGVKEVKFLANPSAGELRIGCSEAMAAWPVSTTIERLTEQHRQRVFHVLTGATATLYRALIERKVDFVVGRVAGVLPEELEDVGGVFDDAVVVAAGVQSRWACMSEIELNDLVNEPWTLPPFDTEMGTIVAEAFQARGLQAPQAMVVAGSTHMRHSLAASGRFLTVIPEFLLKLPVQDQALKALPVELPNSRRTLRIISARNRSLNPLATLFVEMLRHVVRQLTTSSVGTGQGR